jgi:hypothetical protein
VFKAAKSVNQDSLKIPFSGRSIAEKTSEYGKDDCAALYPM